MSGKKLTRYEVRKRTTALREKARTGHYTLKQLADEFKLSTRSVQMILLLYRNRYDEITPISLPKMRTAKNIALANLLRKLGMTIQQIAEFIGVTNSRVSVYFHKSSDYRPTLMVHLSNQVKSVDNQVVPIGPYKLVPLDGKTYATLIGPHTTYNVEYLYLMTNTKVLTAE